MDAAEVLATDVVAADVEALGVEPVFGTGTSPRHPASTTVKIDKLVTVELRRERIGMKRLSKKCYDYVYPWPFSDE